MGYKEDMARCRNYIAEHLQEELTPAELAERFGYSFYHFCHVFRSVNGMAVAEYLRDRRLCAAASQLLLGSSVTETAIIRVYRVSASGTNFSSSAKLSFDEYPHSTELRASIAI